jgi:CCR4-NOT transcriptional regulation complex NOT5 subunit
MCDLSRQQAIRMIRCCLGPCRISGTDIKDKSDLMKARKDVERQMERFKVCEKEMKTKAFSKEGLGQAAKLDPREKARNDMRDWINETVDKLTAEVRSFAGMHDVWQHLAAPCM